MQCEAWSQLTSNIDTVVQPKSGLIELKTAVSFKNTLKIHSLCILR